jgi:hypothetical protein
MALSVEIVVQYYYFFLVTIKEHLYKFSLLLNSVRKHGFLANVFLYKLIKYHLVIFKVINLIMILIIHDLKVHKHESFFTFFAETESLWSQGPVTRDF